MKSYEFENVKELVQQNVEQFIISKIKRTELLEVFSEKLNVERLVRKELKFVSINSKRDKTSSS